MTRGGADIAVSPSLSTGIVAAAPGRNAAELTLVQAKQAGGGMIRVELHAQE